MMDFQVFVWLAVLTTTALSAGGPCEEIQNVNWGGSLGSKKTCSLPPSTVINSKDFLITSERDVTVGAFFVWENEKIEYLPKNLGEKFPSLIVMDAELCSIRAIKKDNFKGLSKLRRLSLYGNQIEKIDDDTFEYIPAVEQFWLWRNKIKQLNGRAFASLQQLTLVRLNSNECIDQHFDTENKIAGMQRIVSEKCGIINF